MMVACAVPPFDATAVNGARQSCDRRWRAHDLLRIARAPVADDVPDWLPDAFARAPFAVVRRAPSAGGFVPVGLRGVTRAQRFGTWVAVEDIDAAISPEHLVASEPPGERGSLPAFIALAHLRDTRSALSGFAWGPTGSVGFELATRYPTVNESSDLDVLIRMPRRCNAATIDQLSETIAHAASLAGTRIDVQLDTPAGGVALAELATGKPRVLARADDGARLVADPWQPA